MRFTSYGHLDLCNTFLDRHINRSFAGGIGFREAHHGSVWNAIATAIPDRIGLNEEATAFPRTLDVEIASVRCDLLHHPKFRGAAESGSDFHRSVFSTRCQADPCDSVSGRYLLRHLGGILRSHKEIHSLRS